MNGRSFSLFDLLLFLFSLISALVFFALLSFLLFEKREERKEELISINLVPPEKEKPKKYKKPKKKKLADKRQIDKKERYSRKDAKKRAIEQQNKKPSAKSIEKKLVESEKKYDLKNYEKLSTSPLFKKFEELGEKLPDEVKKSLRKLAPEKTNNDRIQFSLNTYKWTFEQYIENWAFDLIKWWRAPVDYLSGKIPEGGSVWIKVAVDKDGSLKEYKVFDSKVTSEMELRVIQSLISSFSREILPDEFPEQELVVYWKFIYPPLSEAIDLKKRSR